MQPSAPFSITMRVRLPQRPGAFGQVASAIGRTGAILGEIDLVRVEHGVELRDVTTACVDAAHGERVVAAVREVEGVTVEGVLDRTFEMHQGGKIQINASVRVKTRDDLSMAYTPGVARVSAAIHASPRSWRRAARTTRIRSTTSSPSRASSAGPSTCARERSTRG
jgi:malate dehydrogenase (oxaloacetate-decarboxylating)